MSGKETRGPRNSQPAPRKPVLPPAPPIPTAKAPVPGGPAKPAARKLTWKLYNQKQADMDRIIAVKTPEGRYIHASCADELGAPMPDAKPAPTVVPAHLAGKIASAGGYMCAKCNTFIVPPANKAGREKADADFKKAYRQFVAGEITREQWMSAAERFASSREQV